MKLVNYMKKYIRCGGLYPSEILDMSELESQLESKLKSWLGVPSRVDLPVHDVKFVEDSIHGDHIDFTIDTVEIIPYFISKRDTPLAYRLYHEEYLYINSYSDLACSWIGLTYKYFDGTTLDAYSDTPYSIDINQLDHESDIIGSRIAEIIKSNRDAIYLTIMDYVNYDDDYDDDYNEF